MTNYLDRPVTEINKRVTANDANFRKLIPLAYDSHHNGSQNTASGHYFEH